MTRVKRGTTANKRRRSVLADTKGFRWDRKSKERAAKEGLLHAWTHAFQGRKQKKRDYRALWNVKLNAALREAGTTYSVFMGAAKKAGLALDRKVLAELAEHEPAVVREVLRAVGAPIR